MESKHKEYVDNVIAGKISITDTLSKIVMSLFSSQQPKGSKSKQKIELELYKQNLELCGGAQLHTILSSSFDR